MYDSRRGMEQARKNLKTGRRTTVNRAIKSVVLLLFLAACSGPVQVQIQIDNPEHYKEYVRLLNEKDIDYVIIDERTLSVKVESIDELDEKMKDFEGYVEKELRNKRAAQSKD